MGAPATSGGFPRKNEGFAEAYVALEAGTMILQSSARVGAYNCYNDPDPMNTTAWDPTGHCVGHFTMTGGSLLNDTANIGNNLFIGFTGGDGYVQFLNNSVVRLGFLQVGNADMRTYLNEAGGTSTIWRYGDAELKIGKDADVTAESFTLYDNPNTELQIEIGGSADFSSLACSGPVIIGGIWSTDIPHDVSCKLKIGLVGYAPVESDEFVIVTAGTTMTTEPFSAIITDPLSAGLGWGAKVADGNKLVLYVAHMGDANDDGAVNVGDLGILAGNWNQSGKLWGEADFTGDRTVNVGDLGVLAGNWGWTRPPSAPGNVPEPASLILLGLGGLGLLRPRRKA